MTRARTAWVVWVAVAGAVACSVKTPSPDAKATVSPAPKSVPTTSVPVTPAASPTERSMARAAARVAQVEGDVHLAGTSAAAVRGALLSAGTLVVTGAQGHLALDLENGARCKLYPDSVALLAAHEVGTVVLARGSAHVIAAGPGGATGAPLRIMTAVFSATSPRAAEAWLRGSFRGGLVAVLAGGLDVDVALGSRRAVGGALSVDARQVLAGRLLRVSDARVRIEPGPPNLALAMRLHHDRDTPPSAADADAVDAAFVEICAALDAQRETQRSARNEQQQAHLRGDRARVGSLQAEIVASAARTIALKRSLRQRYGQRLALAAGRSPPDLAAIERIAAQYAEAMR